MKTIHLCLLLVMTCLAFGAKAGASAQANVSQIAVTLFDLDTSDGVAPSFSFLNGTVSLYAYAPWPSTFLTPTYVGDLGESAGSVANSALSLGKASFVAGSGTNLVGMAATAQGESETPPDPDGWVYLVTSFSAEVSAKANFVLSANTRATFHALGEIAGSVVAPFNYSSSSVIATASIYASGPGADGTGIQTVGDGFDRSAYAARNDGSYVVPDKSFNEMSSLDFSFFNRTDQEMHGVFSVWTRAGAVAIAVPEPSEYALLMLGVPFMFFAARRVKPPSGAMACKTNEPA